MSAEADGNREAPMAPRVSRVQWAAERIRQETLHSFRPGDWLPSERKLAEALGVSRVTIGGALAKLRAEGWIERRGRRGHRAMLSREAPPRITGLYVPFRPEYVVATAFCRSVLMGLSVAASENDRHLLSFYGLYRYYRDLQPSRFWSPTMQAVDSLITLEVFRMDLVEQTAKVHPVICLDAACEAPNVSSVVFDNDAAVRMAFKYLLDLGHRRIGYVGRELTDVDPAVAERWAGYQNSLRWSRLAAEPSWILNAASGLGHEPRQRFVRTWQRTPPRGRPTALITTRDFWPLVSTFLLAGVRIPQDISFVEVGVPETWSEALLQAHIRCHDGPLPEWTHGVRAPHTCRPAVLASMEATVAAVPAQQMGRWGIEEVVRRLSDPAAPPRHDVLPPTLIAGDTTGEPAA